MKQIILIALCLFVLKSSIQFAQHNYVTENETIEVGNESSSPKVDNNKVTKTKVKKSKVTKDEKVLTKPKTTIYIRGLGNFTPTDLNEISKSVSDFYGYQCIIESPTSTNPNMYTSDGSSLETINCIKELKREGKKTIYVTNENLVSGTMQLRGGTMFRCNTIIIESCKYNKGTAIHEIGHTLGLGHCHNPKCVMAIYNDEENTYDFCENCKRKLKQ
jgi:hypothetical protein